MTQPCQHHRPKKLPLKDKTKVKIITADPQYPEVGYIDGYVVIDDEPCACVVIGGRIIAFHINQLDVI